MTIENAYKSLVRISASIPDPLLAYELKRSADFFVHGHLAGNPNRERHEDKLDRLVSVLKSMRQEIQSALSDLNTAEEFAKFFEDGLPEEEELDKLLADKKVAGIKDMLKGLGKKKPKPSDEDSSSMEPSYNMSDKDMDDFVEGKEKWDSGKQIMKERGGNRDFLHDVSIVKGLFDKARNGKKDKRSLENILKKLDGLVDTGTKLIGPGGASKKPSGPKKPDLKAQARQLSERLRDALETDEEFEVRRVLSDFFKQVGPSLEQKKAAALMVAPDLIRVAHAHKGLRPTLLPLLRKIAGR